MNHSEMLQRMCHVALAKADLKAIVKARGFPPAAVDPGILTGLFLTEQGLADAFTSLAPEEIGLLHLLKGVGAPVKVSFFERVFKGRRGGTFTQNHQGVLAKVKERFVRTGVLLMFEGDSLDESKMERLRFSLPMQFHPHLPPLFIALHTFDGPGNCRLELVRKRLHDDLRRGKSTDKLEDVPQFHIAEGELRLGKSKFQVSQLARLQFAFWTQQLGLQKSNSANRDANSLEPANAVYQLVASLGEHEWADPAQLNPMIGVFSGQKVDCHAACEAGWQVGMLAKHEAEGKSWYRPAPVGPVLAPSKYLEAHDQSQCVAIDLSLTPYVALETVLQLGNVRPCPSGTPSLLLTPNLIRIGRADESALASDEALWLFRHSQAFKQAQDVLASRRGKTVLHQNILIARVTDLSLKVALDKQLGDRWVSLKNDYVAFPHGALSDVQRIVKKSGHVIKQVSNDER